MDLWVLFIGVFATITFMCLLICKISRLETRLASIDAKTYTDHTEMSRMSRELHTVVYHNIPDCNVKHEKLHTKVLKIQSKMQMSEVDTRAAQIKIRNDVQSLQRFFVDLERRINNLYLVVMNTPVDAAQSAVLHED